MVDETSSGVGGTPDIPDNVANPMNSWEWISIHSTYEIRDRAAIEHVHTHHTKVKPNYPQRFFERRFQWTGSSSTPFASDPEVLSSTKGHPHTLHGPSYVEGDWTFYLVDLGHRLPTGLPVEIETRQTLLDENRTFRSYFRLLVRQPLQHLKLTVVLPDNLYVNVRPTRTHGVSGHPYAVDDLDFQQSGLTAELTVETPELGHEYGITWL